MGHTRDGSMLEKQIYQRRKAFTQEMLIKVLNAEIQGHLVKFPNMTFVSVSDGVKNADGIKYTLYFKPKPVEDATKTKS